MSFRFKLPQVPVSQVTRESRTGDLSSTQNTISSVIHSGLDLDESKISQLSSAEHTENIRNLKRKIDEAGKDEIPKTTKAFIKWRVNVSKLELKLRLAQLEGICKRDDANSENEAERVRIEKHLEEIKTKLGNERDVLFSQSKSLEQEINDSINSETPLFDAYVSNLTYSMEAASLKQNELSKVPTQYRALKSGPFSSQVHNYLGTSKLKTDSQASLAYCNVLGAWLASSECAAAHIVPASFGHISLAYMFGELENPVQSPRNGLCLAKNIEIAFDKGWLTIYPANGVEQNPIEYKVLLLNDAVKDDIVVSWHPSEGEPVPVGLNGKTVWYYRDLDGRQLKFQNDNRPARRYLFIRYALHLVVADRKKWTGYRQKLPKAAIWASPNKPDGYLRKSPLLYLGKITGHSIPDELIVAGEFTDPDSESVAADEATCAKLDLCVFDFLLNRVERDRGEPMEATTDDAGTDEDEDEDEAESMSEDED